MAFGNTIVPVPGSTPAIPWAPPAALAAMNNSPASQAAKTPEPQLAGIARPFPTIRWNEKKDERLIASLLCLDGEDSELYLNPALNFNAPAGIYVTPVAGILRHVAYRDDKTAAEFPHSIGPCPFCPTSDADDKSPNRCENTVDVIVAAVGMPSTGIQQVYGLYTVSARKTSYSDAYTFWYYAVREPLSQGLAPFARTYHLTFQPILAKGRSWNVCRFRRAGDIPETNTWVRERRQGDGSVERPVYRVEDTPANIVADLAARLVDGSIETYGISLFGKATLDVSKEVREQIKRRNAGQPFVAPVVSAPGTFTPPVAGPVGFGAPAGVPAAAQAVPVGAQAGSGFGAAPAAQPAGVAAPPPVFTTGAPTGGFGTPAPAAVAGLTQAPAPTAMAGPTQVPLPGVASAQAAPPPDPAAQGAPFVPPAEASAPPAVAADAMAAFMGGVS